MTDPLKNEELYIHIAPPVVESCKERDTGQHVLVEILGNKEEPDTKKSLINRAKLIF